MEFDWTQARAFLATAETGSLSGAARSLGLTQPTLGRQVSALEEALGVTLFERGGRRMELTEAGRHLLEHARAMGAAAQRIKLTAESEAQGIEGVVSITASDMAAAYHLPPVLTRLRREAPGITLRVVAANDLVDLTRREADIAIRHQRPTQPELIARRLPDVTGELFAARAFLDRVGRPATLADLAKLPFIGLGDNARLAGILNMRGVPVTEANFPVTCAAGVVAWAYLRAGLGVGIMSRDMGARFDDVEIVCPDLFEPLPVETWLTTHRELHTNRRIRIVFDALVQELTGSGGS